MSTDSWELSQELRQIQDTVARFMAAEVKPSAPVLWLQRAAYPRLGMEWRPRAS